MTQEVTVIAPELKPGSGGVGDYTLRLLECLTDVANPKLLIPAHSLDRAESFPYRVQPLARDEDAIYDQLPRQAGKVLVQYSGYGFDALGYPASLIRALCKWKREAGGLLVLVLHEIWTFWPRLNKNAFLQFFHRRALKHLVCCADRVFTTTKSQAEHLEKLAPGKPIQVLPVGSNIRTVENAQFFREPGCAVLFGRGDGRMHTLKKMQASLGSLAQAGRITKIVTVGSETPRGREAERLILQQCALPAGFEQRGPQSERDISALLFTASFGISAQDELSYTKSGTFMAYAAHGLSVLSDYAGLAKDEPLCFLVAPEELLGDISESELKKRADRLCEWQRNMSSWQSIATQVGRALQLGAAAEIHPVLR